jgi:alpha-1,3-rhamnosyl/mannosyltransferase
MSPITVAYDLRWINRDPGGITTYALSLLDALARREDGFRYLAVVNPGDESLIPRYLSRPIPGIELLPVSYGPFSPAGQLLLPAALRRSRADIYHAPNYLGLLTRPGLRTIVTVHDLMAYLFPKRCPQAKAVRFFPLFAFALRRSLVNADAIIAVSQRTADDVGRNFPMVSRKVAVIHSALNPIFTRTRSPHDLSEVLARFGVKGKLILYVGRRDPNKNVVPLIRSVALLRQQGLDVELLLAGKKDERYPEPEQTARELGLNEFFKAPGFVELPDLQALYQAASVMAFPSSYEGFGSPPLEAMASGTPVVCSDRASIPEVVGDAAVFIDPEDPASIAGGIRQVLIDDRLRARLIERGRARAQLFSWDAAAERVVGIYRRLKGLKPRINTD